MYAFLKTGKVANAGPSKSDTTKEALLPRTKHIPWVEKYRPRSVDDVAYQDEVVSVLKKTLQGADLPNLLFYGPPGTGKTSTILAASKQLFGELFSQRVLELNASDERGIQVIREKVKTFAQNAVSSTRSNGQPCPPFKIIILDEADSMTHAAQAALRRTMEKESRSTRFCLICNYVSRIIDPLTSRCSKFRFKPLGYNILVERLSFICKSEGIECEKEALDALIENSEGDLRRAITTLQSAARLMGTQIIKTSDVLEISGVVPAHWLQEFLEVCEKNSYEKLEIFITTFMAEGYSASQLLIQMHDQVIEHHLYTDKQKSAILDKLALCDFCLVEGGDEYLQVLDLGCTIMSC